MKALLSHSPGGPETLVLAEVPTPEPGPGEVRIRVAACAVNFPDLLIVEDKYQYKPQRPFAPGGEIAGVVEAQGDGVTWPAVGDRIMAMSVFGGMSEQLCIGASKCFAIPDAMPFEDAASILMTYGTAYHALVQRAAAKPGQALLVLGAAGGVGLATIQIGRALGLKVIAAASSEEKLNVARLAGAQEGIVYPRAPLDSDGQRRLMGEMKAACGPNGADIVCDPVGGSLTESACRTLAWNGRLLVVGFTASIPKLPLNLLLLKSASAMGVFYGVFAEREPELNRKNIEAILQLYQEDHIKPVISARFPLSRGGEAIEALSRSNATGQDSS